MYNVVCHRSHIVRPLFACSQATIDARHCLANGGLGVHRRYYMASPCCHWPVPWCTHRTKSPETSRQQLPDPEKPYGNPPTGYPTHPAMVPHPAIHHPGQPCLTRGLPINHAVLRQIGQSGTSVHRCHIGKTGINWQQLSGTHGV